MVPDDDDLMNDRSLPFLSCKDFLETCHTFVNNYLARTTSTYSIREHKPPFTQSHTYLVIKRHLHDYTVEGHSSIAGTTSPHGTIPASEDDDIFTEDDDEVLDTSNQPLVANLLPPTHIVEYHILLSPLYEVPVLYFNVYPLINSTRANLTTSIESIYSLLVPKTQREQIDMIGVKGGISQGDHPYLQTPFWFVHPCNTADALREWRGELNLDNYLSIWLGLVGSVVGLRLEVPINS